MRAWDIPLWPVSVSDPIEQKFFASFFQERCFYLRLNLLISFN